MKRRFSNEVPGYHSMKHIETDYFSGYICYTKVRGIENPKFVYELCILKDDYNWFQLYPDNENYVLTIMLDENKNIIQWYFDVSKYVGIENGVPYEDDLYLDMVITKEKNKLILDEDELLDAYNNKKINKTDLDNAYDTLKYLEEKYYNDLDELISFTNKVKTLFK